MERRGIRMTDFGFLNDILKKDQIIFNEAMSRHTTFRTGGPAECFVMPRIDQVGKIIGACRRNGVPVTVIGNGSNLLVGDGGVDGVVIEIGKNMSDITVDGETITAQAGALLSSVAQCALDTGLSGLECESGIPGSVGGAVAMNAGAFGGEIKDVLSRVEVLTPGGDRMELDASELNLSYRYSVLPQRSWIVLTAQFQLHRDDPKQIRARMDELKQKRVAKQPLDYPSAGSTFKRPEGHFAGKLIQDAGLKGACVGGAQVSRKHSGFIINTGKATSADILELIHRVQQTVFEDSGVRLETEVKIIGKFTEGK